VAYATIAPIDITPTVVLKIAIAAEYICSIFLFSAWVRTVKSYTNLCTKYISYMLCLEVDDIIEADLDALDRDIESTRKDLREGLRQRVEAAKKGAKDKASKEAEQALNEDLGSAYIDC
jgi:hypothetical protein